MQQGFAGAGHGGGNNEELCGIGGNELGFPCVLAVKQALARQQIFYNGLFAVEDADFHEVAAGKVGAFAAGAGFVGRAGIGADGIASAVGGGDLGVFEHRMGQPERVIDKRGRRVPACRLRGGGRGRGASSG